MHWGKLIVAFCLILLFFIAFCIWPTTLSMFFWDHLTHKSGALATWVAAFATVIAAIASVVLLSGLWLTKQSMRQSAQDSALQLKKSEQTSVFQRMYEQFNAPTMHYARAVFAKTHLDRKKKYGHGQMVDGYIPSHGWQIVNFLNLGRVHANRRASTISAK